MRFHYADMIQKKKNLDASIQLQKLSKNCYCLEDYDEKKGLRTDHWCTCTLNLLLHSLLTLTLLTVSPYMTSTAVTNYLSISSFLIAHQIRDQGSVSNPCTKVYFWLRTSAAVLLRIQHQCARCWDVFLALLQVWFCQDDPQCL